MLRFAGSVVSYWQSLVTGGIIAALWLVAEKLAGWEPKRAYFFAVFIVVFLLVSFFLSWRDEHRIAMLLDDRKQQQAKADDYAPLLLKGHKVMVYWVDASVKKDEAGIGKYRKEGFEWLEKVRSNLETDFGKAVAARFNLGKPSDTSLGLSEPREHEARVVELERLMREMRGGRLPLRVPSNAFTPKASS